jgi:hypothetical protein
VHSYTVFKINYIIYINKTLRLAILSSLELVVVMSGGGGGGLVVTHIAESTVLQFCMTKYYSLG